MINSRLHRRDKACTQTDLLRLIEKQQIPGTQTVLQDETRNSFSDCRAHL